MNESRANPEAWKTQNAISPLNRDAEENQEQRAPAEGGGSHVFVRVSRAPGKFPQKRGVLAGLLLPPVLAAGAIILLGWGARRAGIAGLCGGSFCDDAARLQFYALYGPGAFCVFLAAYAVYPRLVEVPAILRARRRGAYTAAALAGACAFLAGFIVSAGNRQFGGFDFSTLVDSGWRLMSGQNPYRDFICTMPPVYYLGAYYAFRLFGVTWDAQLWLAAIFSCFSFLWTFGLLAVLLRNRAGAFLTALAIQFAAMLTLSVWWHNNVTSVTAVVFLLSCLVYARDPESRAAQISYAASLALLGFMKPNIGGVAGAGGVGLTLIAVPRRGRTLLLTGAAVLGTMAVLTLQDLSLTGMLASYRAAAADRGFSVIGFRSLRLVDIVRTIGCVSVLWLPFGPCLGRFVRAARSRAWRGAAVQGLVLMGVVLSFAGMFLNAELKDVDWAAMIACGSVAVFGGRAHESRRPWRMARFYIAFLCMLAASDLYIGAMRYRVETVGNQMFFDWRDDRHPAGTAFFSHLSGGPRFHQVLEEMGDAVGHNPGPVFFGPRMEFGYVVFGLRSAPHVPLWWHPGSSFAISDEERILRAWADDRFGTLIFLKNDFTYYSSAFRRLIDQGYSRDERYSQLTVFHSLSRQE